MSKSTEVATTAAALPALAGTPATASQITASDVALPKLYRGETQSNAFKDDLVPKGSIFVATGGDDPDPLVVADKEGESVRIYVLDWKKGKSISVDGDLQTFDFDDPDAPADAWVTHTYVVALPDFAADVPVKLLMTKTSTGTAKQINFLRLRNPGQILAFDLSVKERKSEKNGQKFQWYVWQAKHVTDVTPDHVEAVTKVAELIAGQPTNDVNRSAGNEPAI